MHENTNQDVINGDTVEILASSARNSTTPIRPYYHHNLSERANHRQQVDGLQGVFSD